MLESGAKVRVDQAELETVIPVSIKPLRTVSDWILIKGLWKVGKSLLVLLLKSRLFKQILVGYRDNVLSENKGMPVQNIGGTVQILNGAFRGQTATMVSVDVNNFSAKVQIKGGAANKREVSLPYEDICKLSAYA